MFNKIVLLLFLWIFTLPADGLKEIENYIYSRTGQAAVQESNHCAFRHQLDLRLRLNELSPQLKTQAMALLERPARQKSTISPSGHFTLHYDTAGYQSVPLEDLSKNGTPDYIDSALVIFDHVWDVEINQLGFQPPPAADGSAIENYHIYFTKSYSYYGWTTPDQQISSGPVNTFTSFIEINANFYQTHFYTGGLNALRVTAAHEFNHAIQLGYNLRADEYGNYSELFFLEMTSTWLEDYVYEDVNDYYQYLNNFIPNIDKIKFNAAYNNYEYANSLYLHMLEEKFGARIVPEIWKAIIQQEVIPAVNSVLQTKGSSFGHAQNDYGCWLYFTGERSIAGHYFPEGANYPMLTPGEGQEEIESDLGSLQMRHVQVDVQDSLLFMARVSAGSNDGRFNHISKNGMFHSSVRFGSAQSVYQNAESGVLIAVLSNPTENVIEQIEYALKIHKPVTGPNPLHVKQDGSQMVFYNIPARGKIYIYSLNGRFLASIQSAMDRPAPLNWNLRDKSGALLASGIYIFVVKSAGSESVGKFAVVR